MSEFKVICTELSGFKLEFHFENHDTVTDFVHEAMNATNVTSVEIVMDRGDEDADEEGYDPSVFEDCPWMEGLVEDEDTRFAVAGWVSSEKSQPNYFDEFTVRAPAELMLNAVKDDETHRFAELWAWDGDLERWVLSEEWSADQ